MVNYSNRMTIVGGTELSEMFFRGFFVFVSRPIDSATFPRKNCETPKFSCSFSSLKKHTHRKKNWKSSVVLSRKFYNNNAKDWKSSERLRVKPNILEIFEDLQFFIFSSV